MSGNRRRSRRHGAWSTAIYFDGGRSVWVVHVLELDRTYEAATLHLAMHDASRAIESDSKRPFRPDEAPRPVTFTTDSPKLEDEFQTVLQTAREGFHRGRNDSKR